MVIEKKISKKKSHYKSMQGIYPQCFTSLHPRGLIGRIYKCRIPLNITIHTKYISCGPDGFRRVFFHYKSMGAINLHGVAILDPRCLIGRINVVEQ